MQHLDDSVSYYILLLVDGHRSVRCVTLTLDSITMSLLVRMNFLEQLLVLLAKPRALLQTPQRRSQYERDVAVSYYVRGSSSRTSL